MSFTLKHTQLQYTLKHTHLQYTLKHIQLQYTLKHIQLQYILKHIQLQYTHMLRHTNKPIFKKRVLVSSNIYSGIRESEEGWKT